MLEALMYAAGIEFEVAPKICCNDTTYFPDFKMSSKLLLEVVGYPHYRYDWKGDHDRVKWAALEAMGYHVYSIDSERVFQEPMTVLLEVLGLASLT
jgi:very-short-patch-repair endonuclease